MTSATLGQALTDAIRYWERRRILYNLALAAIVVVYVIADWPATRMGLNWEVGLRCFLLAVLANVAYCAAYIPDILVQLSDLRPAWLRYRWVLFAIGLVFAGIITQFIVSGLFTNVATVGSLR